MCLDTAYSARQHAIALQNADRSGENEFDSAAAIAKLVRGIGRFMCTGHMVSHSSVTTTLSSLHVKLLPSRHLKFTAPLLRPAGDDSKARTSFAGGGTSHRPGTFIQTMNLVRPELACWPI
jgi:hypothetical protein